MSKAKRLTDRQARGFSEIAKAIALLGRNRRYLVEPLRRFLDAALKEIQETDREMRAAGRKPNSKN